MGAVVLGAAENHKAQDERLVHRGSAEDGGTTAPGRFVIVEEKRWVPWYSALAENHEAQDVRLVHRGSAEDGGT
ncbi:MAG: hypothetical protein ACYS0G_15425, partial [Planctomycetota bacterium]